MNIIFIFYKLNIFKALSIRPDFKDLWFNCGWSAAKQMDWHTAEFCFKKCIDEIRALEALLLVYYLSANYPSIPLANFLKKSFDNAF